LWQRETNFCMKLKCTFCYSWNKWRELMFIQDQQNIKTGNKFLHEIKMHVLLFVKQVERAHVHARSTKHQDCQEKSTDVTLQCHELFLSWISLNAQYHIAKIFLIILII
jgi:hypothetical protein